VRRREEKERVSVTEEGREEEEKPLDAPVRENEKIGWTPRVSELRAW